MCCVFRFAKVQFPCLLYQEIETDVEYVLAYYMLFFIYLCGLFFNRFYVEIFSPTDEMLPQPIWIMITWLDVVIVLSFDFTSM